MYAWICNKIELYLFFNLSTLYAKEKIIYTFHE